MKKLLFTSLLLAASLTVSAFDFGGMLTNNSKFADLTPDDGIKLVQKNAVKLWGKHTFKGTDNYVLVQGQYQFEHNFGFDKNTQAVNLDIAQFVLAGKNLTAIIGRSYKSDVSGIVYSQPGDGINLTWKVPGFKAGAYVYYTGLLNSQFVTIITDPAADYMRDPDKLYDLNAKYFVSGLSASLSNFWKEQTVTAEVICTANLDKTTYNRFYAEGQLEGPLPLTGLFYDVTGVVEYSVFNKDDPEYDFLTGANLFWYPGTKDAQVVVHTVYASGSDTTASTPLRGFKGFTSQTAVNSLSEPEYSGIFISGLSAAFKPVQTLKVSAGADAVFSTENKKNEYKGFQCAAALDFQVLSDVYAGVDFTRYQGKDDSGDDKTAVTVKVSVSF
jgi:hypothetical protein